MVVNIQRTSLCVMGCYASKAKADGSARIASTVTSLCVWDFAISPKTPVPAALESAESSYARPPNPPISRVGQTTVWRYSSPIGREVAQPFRVMLVGVVLCFVMAIQVAQL